MTSELEAPASHAATGAPAAVWVDLRPQLGMGGNLHRQHLQHRATSACAAHTAQLLREALHHPSAAAGGRVVLATTPAVVAAAAGLTPAERQRLVVVGPDLRGLIREATELGLMAAGARRMLRLGAWQVLRLGLTCMPEAPGVLRRQFPAMLRVLARVELAQALRLRAGAFVLQAQLTDLAVGMGNPALLHDVVRLVRRAGLQPGLATANPAALDVAALTAHDAAAGPGAPPLLVLLSRGSRPASAGTLAKAIIVGAPDTQPDVELRGLRAAPGLAPAWEPPDACDGQGADA